MVYKSVLNKGYRYKSIKTERLVLIKPDLKYTLDYYSYLSDKHMWKYDSLKELLTKKNIINFLKKRIKSNKTKKEFFFLILLDGKLVGSIGTNWIDKFAKKTEISYEIAYPYWNKGYGTEALSAYIDWMYQNTSINRIEAGFVVPNIGSKRMLVKNGFKKEGLMREASIHNNKTYDNYLCALLRKDWVKREKKK